MTTTTSVTLHLSANDGNNPISYTINGFTKEYEHLLESLLNTLRIMKEHFAVEGRGGSTKDSYMFIDSDFPIWFTTKTEEDENRTYTVSREEVTNFYKNTNQEHLQTWAIDPEILEGYVSVENSGFHGEYDIDEVTITTTEKVL